MSASINNFIPLTQRIYYITAPFSANRIYMISTILMTMVVFAYCLERVESFFLMKNPPLSRIMFIISMLIQKVFTIPVFLR